MGDDPRPAGCPGLLWLRLVLLPLAAPVRPCHGLSEALQALSQPIITHRLPSRLQTVDQDSCRCKARLSASSAEPCIATSSRDDAREGVPGRSESRETAIGRLGDDHKAERTFRSATGLRPLLGPGGAANKLSLFVPILPASSAPEQSEDARLHLGIGVKSLLFNTL